MAKRRAEDALLPHDSPSKRRHRSVPVDQHQESLSPPSLLPGNRCRKRSYHHFTCPEHKHGDADLYLYRESTRCDGGGDVKCTDVKQTTDVSTVQNCGTFQHHSTSDTSRNKRPRGDCTDPHTVVPPTPTHVTADGDSSTEDCAYNSFQYWRLPLPKLDLSLLEDVDSHSRAEQTSKVKRSSTQCEDQQANMMSM